MKIGAKMRQIRQHWHLTQRELGEKIGLGKNGANRIAQYEMEYRTPKRDQSSSCFERAGRNAFLGIRRNAADLAPQSDLVRSGRYYPY